VKQINVKAYILAVLLPD